MYYNLLPFYIFTCPRYHRPTLVFLLLLFFNPGQNFLKTTNQLQTQFQPKCIFVGMWLITKSSWMQDFWLTWLLQGTHLWWKVQGRTQHSCSITFDGSYLSNYSWYGLRSHKFPCSTINDLFERWEKHFSAQSTWTPHCPSQLRSIVKQTIRIATVVIWQLMQMPLFWFKNHWGLYVFMECNWYCSVYKSLLNSISRF